MFKLSRKINSDWFHRPVWNMALYLIAVIIGVFLAPLLLLVITAVFPAILLVDINKNNWPLSLPLVSLFNLVLIVVYAVALDFLALPITLVSLAAVHLAVIAGIYLALEKGYFSKLTIEVLKKDKYYLWGILGVGAVAIITRVASVAGMSAPILHDPIAHAFWAQEIVRTQTIDYFYSPGLHILVAYTSMATNISVAYLTHLATNAFNALAPVTWGLAAYGISKNRFLGLVTAVITYFMPIPSLLYSKSGKNAMVLAMALMPVSFYLFYAYMKHNTRVTIGLLWLLLIGVGLVHYPTLAFTLGAIGFGLVFYLVRGYRANSINKAQILKLVGSILLVLALVGGWASLNLFSPGNQPGGESVRLQKATVNSNTKSLVSQVVNAGENTVTSTKNYIREFTREYRGLSFIFPGTLVAGLGYLVARRKDELTLGIFAFALSVFTVPIVVELLQLITNRFNILQKEAPIFIFQLIGLLAAIIVYDIYRKLPNHKLKTYTALTLVALAVAFYGYQEFHYFNRSQRLSLVDETDLQAYEWIEGNVPNQAGFINNAHRSPLRKKIIFPSDGAAWLPIYTDNPVSMPFQEVRFNKSQTHANFDLYQSILQSNKNDLGEVCALRQKGFTYYYYDKRFTYSKQLMAGDFDIQEKPELVYENSGVAIYQVNNDCVSL